MAKAAAVTLSFLLLFLSGDLLAVNGYQKTWCVPRPSSDHATLLANIDYACSQVDCRIMQKGCPCFYPDNLINHASIAMNLYYNSKGKNQWNCDFRGSGLIVITDPSYGNCLYP
ncbi:major pollen allergen Ole e 10-like isoform X1 [Cucurbita maxima]|uniref:Major pollen allergen Ole e 10-like isoform X1 n=1 Tax=Cucurbita maxima TaxID=3661 RepID=A0A6J1J1Y2_CUCMA|nr:major pollen allergen Ole e 10-like isoform X1 [Cucurbita maxima]